MDGFLSSSKGFVNVANPIKRFKGSTRDVLIVKKASRKNTYQFYNAIRLEATWAYLLPNYSEETGHRNYCRR